MKRDSLITAVRILFIAVLISTIWLVSIYASTK